MLPLSLVEDNAFIEFVNYLDPSFAMPTRKTVKSTGIPNLKESVFIKMKKLLQNIKYPNACVDGWSDASARKFNGYICQGIDNDWNLVTLPIEFKHFKGTLAVLFVFDYIFFSIIIIKGSSTGDAIHKQYKEVIKNLEIHEKVIKIVCDQAANMIKGFKETTESNEVVNGVCIVELTKDLLFQQKQKDLLIKQQEMEENFINEINDMN